MEEKMSSPPTAMVVVASSTLDIISVFSVHDKQYILLRYRRHLRLASELASRPISSAWPTPPRTWVTICQHIQVQVIPSSDFWAVTSCSLFTRQYHYKWLGEAIKIKTWSKLEHCSNLTGSAYERPSAHSLMDVRGQFRRRCLQSHLQTSPTTDLKLISKVSKVSKQIKKPKICLLRGAIGGSHYL